MKIIITENQFKKLIENIIKEQEDPKALELLNYLMKYEEGEYGMIHIKSSNSPLDEYGINYYVVGDVDRGKHFDVGTRDEFDKYFQEKFNTNDTLNLFKKMGLIKSGNYYIRRLN